MWLLNEGEPALEPAAPRQACSDCRGPSPLLACQDSRPACWQRAEKAGYGALAVTVDAPRLGRREADIRNGCVRDRTVPVLESTETYCKRDPQLRPSCCKAAYTDPVLSRM